jgi:hypothetical protein
MNNQAIMDFEGRICVIDVHWVRKSLTAVAWFGVFS